MVTSQDCINKYGKPLPEMEYRHMCLYDIPVHLRNAMPELPARIYCNNDLVTPLAQALQNIYDRGLCSYIETWDGCFNIRKIRGYENNRDRWSLHSWAIALDINAARNGLGKKPQMPKELIACFTDAGFDWGGNFTRPDGMHFQLAAI